MNTKNKKKSNKTELKRVTYTNKNIGFSIAIPDNWLEVKKTSYEELGINDNTLFIFVVNKFVALSAVFSGYADEKIFNKFFNKYKSNEKYKTIYKNDVEINKINVKQIVIETKNNKVMHNFCLINNMIVNFTINIDPKNKIFDSLELTKDINFKIMNETLNTIKVFEPVNPPIYINKEEKENFTVELIDKVELNKENNIKNIAQILIEKDCKYKRILLPELYFKYLYSNIYSNISLNIVNDEIYYKDLNNGFKLIEIPNNILEELKTIFRNNILKLEEFNISEETNSNNTLLLKIDSKYIYIDLNKNTDNTQLRNILDDVVNIIKQQTNFDLNIVMPTLEEPIIKKEESNLEIEDFTVEIVDKIEEKEIEINNEENIQEEERNEEPIINSISEGAVVAPIAILTEETEENKDEDTQEETNIDNNSIEYNQDDFQEYFHNVDGHASFRFIFPVASGEKLIRDFNVFDIVNNDQLMYRVFIFKCESEEKYQIKLRDWMNKNIQSNKTTLKEEYINKKDNYEIKTYILENGKFYKVIYVAQYLIAISGYNDESVLMYADIALENVEIGEDSRSFVESYDRKMRSISILQAQQIPYIDELPAIQSSYETSGKTLDEIAKRAIVLCVCCNFANDLISNKKRRYIKESKKFFNKLLDTFNVKDAMTKDEKLLFDKLDKKVATQMAWQFEGYVVLLWTLGLVRELPFPDTLVEPDEVTALVSTCNNYREFVANCQLRDVHEVLDLADLTYRYNWYCVEAKINGEEPVMDPEIVLERHRALNWLITQEKWEKVKIDT